MFDVPAVHFNSTETFRRSWNNLFLPLIFFPRMWLSKMFSLPLTYINESAAEVRGPNNLSSYSFLVTNYSDEGRSNKSKTHFSKIWRLHCKCQDERKLQLGRGNYFTEALEFWNELKWTIELCKHLIIDQFWRVFLVCPCCLTLVLGLSLKSLRKCDNYRCLWCDVDLTDHWKSFQLVVILLFLHIF